MEVEMDIPIRVTELSPDLNGIGTATLHSPVLEFSWAPDALETPRYDHTITVRFQTAKGVPLADLEIWQSAKGTPFADPRISACSNNHSERYVKVIGKK